MSARELALEARLAEIMPLFVEARDALPAISIVSAKLGGVSLSLAGRMDAVGTKDWRAALEADIAAPQEPAVNAELLAALKQILSWVDNWSPELTLDPDWPADRDAARAAIAKAKAGAA